MRFRQTQIHKYTNIQIQNTRMRNFFLFKLIFFFFNNFYSLTTFYLAFVANSLVVGAKQAAKTFWNFIKLYRFQKRRKSYSCCSGTYAALCVCICNNVSSAKNWQPLHCALCHKQQLVVRVAAAKLATSNQHVFVFLVIFVHAFLPCLFVACSYCWSVYKFSRVATKVLSQVVRKSRKMH